VARPKHPRKELEAILVVIEDEGAWRVDKPGKYYRCRCPCGQHSKYVHLTPSPSPWRRGVPILQEAELLGR